MITIAEVLHRSADEFLSLYSKSWLGYDARNSYSCMAVSDCLSTLWEEGVITRDEECQLETDIFIGLEAMGVDTNSVEQFAEFPYNMMQDARYGWLKFAAMIAEEQGA